MAEVTRKRMGELLRKLFEILLRSSEPVQASEALEVLYTEGKPTAFENSNYPSGGRRFEKNVRFATVDTVKAGWLLKSKGKWSVTEEGRAALRKYPDAEEFYREAVRLYHEWKASQPLAEAETTEEAADTTSAKSTRITYEEAEEQ